MKMAAGNRIPNFILSFVITAALITDQFKPEFLLQHLTLNNNHRRDYIMSLRNHFNVMGVGGGASNEIKSNQTELK